MLAITWLPVTWLETSASPIWALYLKFDPVNAYLRMSIPPPAAEPVGSDAVLPDTVLLVSVAPASLSEMPPPRLLDVFPETTVPVSDSGPPE